MWKLCVQHRKPIIPSLTRFYGERTIVYGLLFVPDPSFEKQRQGLWSRWWFLTCSDGKNTEFGPSKDLMVSMLISYNVIYDKPDTDTKKVCYLCFKGCTTIKTPKVHYEMPSTFQHFTNQRSSYFFVAEHNSICEQKI